MPNDRGDVIESELLRRANLVSHGRVAIDSVNLQKNLFSELSLDSLDFAEILYGSAASLQLQVNEDVDWTSISTLEEMAGHLRLGDGA